MTSIADTRFEFGENWLRFASSLTQAQIVEAEHSLIALVGRSDLSGLSFLDIGCGSGLFSLAARRLGASVVSFDIDANSVECTAALRQRYCPQDSNWSVQRGSILDRAFINQLGAFDIVYAWGSLHHTGAFDEAITQAVFRVAGGGMFVFAVYRKTALCWLWRLEKRWYCQASQRSQAMARSVYVNLFRLAFMLTGRNFQAYVKTCQERRRGMNFHDDVADWLGGYPYESMSPTLVRAILSKLGFEQFIARTRGFSFGLLGSGCDEYVFRRRA